MAIKQTAPKPLTPMRRYQEVFSAYKKELEALGFSLVTLTGTNIVRKPLDTLGLEEHDPSNGYGCYYSGYRRNTKRGVSSDYLLLGVPPGEKTDDHATSIGLEVRFKTEAAAIRFTVKQKNGPQAAPTVIGSEYLTVPEGVALLKELASKAHFLKGRGAFLDLYAQLVFKSPSLQLALQEGKDSNASKVQEILDATGITALKNRAQEAQDAQDQADTRYWEELKQTPEYLAVKAAEQALADAHKRLKPITDALAKKHQTEELGRKSYKANQDVDIAVYNLKKSSVF